MHQGLLPKDVAAALQPIRAELRALGVRHVSVFGSVVRGEANANSDVDLALDVNPANIATGLLS